MRNNKLIFFFFFNKIYKSSAKISRIKLTSSLKANNNPTISFCKTVWMTINLKNVKDGNMGTLKMFILFLVLNLYMRMKYLYQIILLIYQMLKEEFYCRILNAQKNLIIYNMSLWWHLSVSLKMGIFL
jgi:hypothetical protein